MSKTLDVIDAGWRVQYRKADGSWRFYYDRVLKQNCVFPTVGKLRRFLKKKFVTEADEFRVVRPDGTWVKVTWGATEDGLATPNLEDL